MFLVLKSEPRTRGMSIRLNAERPACGAAQAGRLIRSVIESGTRYIDPWPAHVVFMTTTSVRDEPAGLLTSNMTEVLRRTS